MTQPAQTPADLITAWRTEAKQEDRKAARSRERGLPSVLGHDYRAHTLREAADQLEQALGLPRVTPTVQSDEPAPF